jgi:hypothetical protein
MDLRRAKQVIYGAFYLIVVIGIIAGARFLFFRPAPSCFDHVQNEGEQGVDCGGPCAKVCIPANLQDITTLNMTTFVSNPGQYTFLAQVANANPGFAAESFNYSFDLYDASGALIQSVPGQSFLYSGEVKYLLVPGLLLASPPANASLTITNVSWVPAGTLGSVPDFNNENQPTVTGVTISSSTIAVSGELTDDDVADFTNVLVIAVFKDANGNAVGASQTIIDNIVPGQTQNFTVMYPATPIIDSALTQLYAYALR